MPKQIPQATGQYTGLSRPRQTEKKYLITLPDGKKVEIFGTGEPKDFGPAFLDEVNSFLIPQKIGKGGHSVASRVERAKGFPVGRKPNVGNSKKAIIELALTFPTLQRTVIKDWQPEDWSFYALETLILKDASITMGGHWAGMFILSVWVAHCNTLDSFCVECDRTSMTIGFDLQKALSCWDAAHHTAFLAWAADPWTA